MSGLFELIDLVEDNDEHEVEVLEVNGDPVDDVNDDGQHIQLVDLVQEDEVNDYQVREVASRYQEEINEEQINDDEVALVASRYEGDAIRGEKRCMVNNNESSKKKKFDKTVLLARCTVCYSKIREGNEIWRCEKKHVICSLCKTKRNSICSCNSPVNARDKDMENFALTLMTDGKQFLKSGYTDLEIKAILYLHSDENSRIKPYSVKDILYSIGFLTLETMDHQVNENEGFVDFSQMFVIVKEALSKFE